MSKLLENNVALVTGGLGDIGRAIAEIFAREGAALALCGTRPVADAQDFVSDIQRTFGVPCRYDTLDVSNADAVKQWIVNVEQHLGTPNLIIANAATVTLGNVLEITSEQWSKEIDINLNGAFHLAQHAAKILVQEGQRGHIVFIGSWAAHAVHLNMPAYCVSKAAIRMLCKCMALELAPHGIMVNEVAPGYVYAGLSGKLMKENPALVPAALDRIPVGEMMTAEEVAAEVLHLCRGTNRHITGSTVLMDGGLSLQSIANKKTR